MDETRIETARVVVAGVQAEIDDLKHQLADAQRALAILSANGTEFDADAVARRAALVEVIDNLQLRLPKTSWRRGEALPLVQLRLQKAEGELERIRGERFNLAVTIAEIEAESDAWGDGTPAEVEAALALVYRTCARVGEYPPGANERMLGGMRFWARSVRERIEALPALRIRLESYGPDPDYRPAADWAEIERGWQQARMKLTFMRERLHKLGVSL